MYGMELSKYLPMIRETDSNDAADIIMSRVSEYWTSSMPCFLLYRDFIHDTCVNVCPYMFSESTDENNRYCHILMESTMCIVGKNR